MDSIANVVAGLVKSASNIFSREEKQEPQTEGSFGLPEASEPGHPGPNVTDQLALSAQITGQAQSQNLKTITDERTPAPLLPGHELLAEKSGQVLKQGAVEVEHRDESPQNSRGLAGFEEAVNEAGQQPPELGKMLHTWMQVPPETLKGLQNFLEVEFSHYSADPQTFQTFQLISMLREARQLLEQQKLRDANASTDAAGPSEEAEKALLGASLMGYAYYVLRKKNLKERTAVGLETAALKDELASELSLCLDEVLDYLKKAEAGLQRAMAEGADNRRLRLLIHKVLDVCADIVELKREFASNPNMSAA